MGFLKKTKNRVPYDPAIPLMGIYPEKTMVQKDTCTPIFTAALLTIAKTWKQPKCLLADKCIKMWYIHTHTHTEEYYSAIKNSETMPFEAT